MGKPGTWIASHIVVHTFERFDETHWRMADNARIGGFAMAVPRREIRTWILCFSCGSAIPLESIWIDEELLCRECAFRLMLERINKSALADLESREAFGP
jgi:DNA-directed RNA polymerase subunit RPC12/RpoP